MKESIIVALVKLFAIIESARDKELVSYDAECSKKLFKNLLQKNRLNEKLIKQYLDDYLTRLSFYSHFEYNLSDEEEPDNTLVNHIRAICESLNKELVKSDRVVVFITLIEVIFSDGNISEKEYRITSLVAKYFHLDTHDVENIFYFIAKPEEKKVDSSNLLLVKSTDFEKEEEHKKYSSLSKRLYINNFPGKLVVLHISGVNSLIFRFEGKNQGKLYFEGEKVVPKKIYLLTTGSIITGIGVQSIYQNEIFRFILEESVKDKVVLEGEKISFEFVNSNNGIKPFSFSEISSQLIGIMGGSGTGKTTLINLLNGNIPPDKGKITVNGFPLHEAIKKGVIGYVPQDDLLFEELTVKENLYFNAQLSLNNLSKKKQKKIVNKVLEILGLDEIKGLTVGSVLSKTISGGQRKRLNIALELLREPSLLFIDEPTSGLSSVDSERMMEILKKLTQKGILVVTILHQPSSYIFKLLDKLWILDTGGYVIYNGNPIEALVYFKTMSTHVNAAESECYRCGNLIPEQILEIIESKEIDDFGSLKKVRKVTPKKWYSFYLDKIAPKIKKYPYKKKLPLSKFSIPNRRIQFKIFSHRNIKAKVSSNQYLLVALLESPFLAFVLGYFSKFSGILPYSFSKNINLPVYLFMMVVVSLFIGLSVSAQEIHKDQRILKREQFLNLSRSSYLNSKILYLFTLSAFQTLCFILVGNYLFEIKGMTLYYWIILFSTSCCANMIGLNISSAFSSVVTIYIIIPFILVPQLLLGGAMVKFDELNRSFSNQKYVTLIGDFMASRWAYEAITVSQFKYNQYEKIFFDAEMDISQNSFRRSILVPELKSINSELLQDPQAWKLSTRKFKIMKYELNKLATMHDLKPFEHLDKIAHNTYSLKIGEELKGYLNYAQQLFAYRYLKSTHKKDSIYNDLVKKIGSKNVIELEKENVNEKLKSLMKNSTFLSYVIRGENQLIQKKDPIFMPPYSNYGRAHYFAPYKVIGKIKIPTIIFNILIIWLINSFLYVMLYYDFLKRWIFLVNMIFIKTYEYEEQTLSLLERLKRLNRKLLNRWNHSKTELSNTK